MKGILTAIGVIGFLILLFMVFAPTHQISENITTRFINPVTSNTTATILTAQGTIPAYNGFQNALGASFFWIVIIGLVIAAIFIAAKSFNTGGQE